MYVHACISFLLRLILFSLVKSVKSSQIFFSVVVVLHYLTLYANMVVFENSRHSGITKCVLLKSKHFKRDIKKIAFLS